MNTHRLDPEQWNITHREALLRFALRKVSDFGHAEDLVQDTFVSAWHGRKQFRGDCSERTWLTGILRNKIVDFYRRNSRRPAILTSDLDPVQDEGSGLVPWIERQADPDDRNLPTATTERLEFMADLEEAVDRLPAKMGQAFRMREINGLSTEEITRELNITKANLWVLIHRAKLALGESLADDWSDVEHFGHLAAA
ncbi:MAG TPA: sigma-70 family RNA polymerase sigma factor, partial [Bacteroidia bacterium]|nr:sigma-70 family RNA polymerase sigma factor [Bacteroidia bacterium]